MVENTKSSPSQGFPKRSIWIHFFIQKLVLRSWCQCRSGAAPDVVRLRKRKQNGHRVFLFFLSKLVGKVWGKIWIIRTLLWSKGWWEKKPARVLRLSGPSERREIVWDVYVKEMTYMSTVSQPTRERDGWVERKRKKEKSLWKMKCDSQSLGKVNLDHEFPQRWETWADSLRPLQSTTSALITQPESNLASLVFSEA